MFGGGEDSDEEGFCSKFCKGMLCAFCIAPLLVIGAMILWGYNEKRAVCDARAIDQGKDEVVELSSCSSKDKGLGELVTFSCDLDQEASFNTFKGTGDFSSVLSFRGAGLQTVSEMFQCIESKSTSTKTNSDGGKQTVTTYSYRMDWSSKHVTISNPSASTSTEMESACGIKSSDPNPAFPAGLPSSAREFSDKKLVAGAFSIDVFEAKQIPLSETLKATAPPVGWTLEADGKYASSKWATVGNTKGIGNVRTEFRGSDNDKLKVTILGKNVDGVIKVWEADGSWLCSGYTLKDGRLGTVSKDDLFKGYEKGNTFITWLLRVVGFAVAWFGFSRLAEPCEAVGDCIPCIGEYVGNAIEFIACIVAYFPACACCFLVCGIVWVAMRPYVGIPLLVIAAIMASVFIWWKWKKSKQSPKKEDPEVGDQEDNNVPAPQTVGDTE